MKYTAQNINNKRLKYLITGKTDLKYSSINHKTNKQNLSETSKISPRALNKMETK